MEVGALPVSRFSDHRVAMLTSTPATTLSGDAVGKDGDSHVSE
jgi:hypothetical protein